MVFCCIDRFTRNPDCFDERDLRKAGNSTSGPNAHASFGLGEYIGAVQFDAALRGRLFLRQ